MSPLKAARFNRQFARGERVRLETTSGPSIFLDTLNPTHVQVGYGQLGMKGNLGYEDKRASVRGTLYPQALSTHPPARLVFDLGGRFATFRSSVAINDDVPSGRSSAQFSVFADGRLKAVAALVNAGEAPREITADIRGAQRLELVVTTRRWEFCHAVWLDPQVEHGHAAVHRVTIPDCLGRTEMFPPSITLRSQRCVAAVVSAGYSHLLDDMLGSLVANGGCPEALIVV